VEEVVVARSFSWSRFSHPGVALAAALAVGAPLAATPSAARAAESGDGLRQPDVVYVPTPQEVVDTMLDLAKVGKNDVVYDLGCGDGRIVVEAAKRGAKKAVGVDIDPARVAEARANVREAKVEDRAKIVEGDLFELDLKDATVVALYLLPELNLRLRPKLLQLPPGTRIVSHAFDMGDWKADEERSVAGKTVYFWTVPPPGKAHASKK
jgi:SAM-dependent methyltransferase